MKKDGFTLIELLATIVIIGMIIMIGIPSIIGISNKIRKDYLVDDANKLIAQAKYLVNRDHVRYERIFYFPELNANGDIGKDPDGGEYDVEHSYVRYYGHDSYCITLIGSKRSIGANGCVLETDINPDTISAYNEGDPIVTAGPLPK